MTKYGSSISNEANLLIAEFPTGMSKHANASKVTHLLMWIQ